MLRPEERERIRRMQEEGFGVTDIARELGISRTTVYAYLRDELRGTVTKPRGRRCILEEADQRRLAEAFQALDRNAAALTHLLNTQPEHFGLPESFVVSARTVMRYVRTLSPAPKAPAKPAKASVSTPGQRLQVTVFRGEFRFCGQSLSTPLAFFTALLPWSRKAFVKVLPGTAENTYVTSLSECLARWGFPAEILCDEDSVIVEDRVSREVRFHPDVEWLLKPLGVPVKPSRFPRTPVKGAVDRFGRYFKEGCLPVLQYRDEGIRRIEDLQKAVDAWLTETAEARRFEGRTVAERFEEERGRLVVPENGAECLPAEHRIVSVLPQGVVFFCGQTFRLTPERAGTFVFVTVRRNGDFRISDTDGRELLAGRS